MSNGNFDTLDNQPTIPGQPEGQILSGRYRIIREIGSGGMGTVYLAEDTELDDMQVAVKVLPAILANNKSAINNLRREAKTTLKLSHPNIVRLHTFQSDEAIKYLVMEYVDGGNLEEKISAAGALSVDDTLEIFTQVAAGLDYAHSQNVIHRDIKPSNIMLTADGGARLADFGIARQLKDSMTRITGKETSGTLLYMAPEQFRGGEPDHRSDIYSLAASIYECLSGKPPFWRGSIEYQILNENPEPLEKLNNRQNAAILKALSKIPKDRQANTKELLNNLGADLVDKGRQENLSDKILSYDKTIKTDKGTTKPRQKVQLFIAAAVLLLLVIGAFLSTLRHKTNEQNVFQPVIVQTDVEEKSQTAMSESKKTDIGSSSSQKVEMQKGKIITELLDRAHSLIPRIAKLKDKTDIYVGIALAQVDLHKMVEAREMFRQSQVIAMKIEDPKESISALCNIGESQIKVRELVEANVTFSIAKQVAGRLNHKDKVDAYCEIAKFQIRAGDMVAGQETFRQTRDLVTNALVNESHQEDNSLLSLIKHTVALKGKSERLCSIAGLQAEVGDNAGAQDTLNQARVIADSIGDPKTRADAYCTILCKQVDVGNTGDARQLYERIESDIALIDFNVSGEDSVLVTLVNAQAGLGEITKAMATLRRIKNSRLIDSAYVDIAMAQAKAGDYKNSMSTVAKIVDIRSRLNTYSMIANLQLERENVPAVIETLKLADADRPENWKSPLGSIDAELMTYGIITVQLKTGDIVGATLRTMSIVNPGFKDIAYSSVVDAQIQSHDLIGARITADKILQLPLKVELYSRIAECFSDTGNFNLAKETLCQAKELLQNITDVNWPARKFAKAQAEIGSSEDLENIFGSLGNEQLRAYAYLGAAEGLIELAKR